VNPIQTFFSWLTGTTQLKHFIKMHFDQIKTLLVTAAANNAEAFSEISAKIGGLQAQIEELIAGNSNPDVTDAEFLAALESLKGSAQSLADLVPNPPVPEVPAAPVE
jgi:hypothetical protein